MAASIVATGRSPPGETPVTAVTPSAHLIAALGTDRYTLVRPPMRSIAVSAQAMRRPRSPRFLLLMPMLLALLTGCGVNNIPTFEENAKAKWAQVLNEYQRRADLIPNLVETVKGFAKQESTVLEAVTGARAQATSIKVDASTITVETKDKKQIKLLVDGSTKFEKSGSAAALKDLSVGKRVVIHAAKKGADLTAVLVKFGAGPAHPDSGEGHTRRDSSGSPAQTEGHTVAISVTEEGFTPANAKVKKGEPVSLVITRKTDQTCAKEVVIKLADGTNIAKPLPLNTPVEIATTFPTGGKLGYACGMDMVKGTITVE